MREPRATYRLQLTPAFGFDAARAAVPYLARLGIGEAYLSPALEARAGSEHGYDVVDPARLRAELGGARAFDRLARALTQAGMGMLLDLVPNHMAVSDRNTRLVDVLARGATSRYERTFDIDRRAPGVGGALLLPVLGAPLEDVLARGELQIERAGGRAWLRYHEHRFPLSGALPARASRDLDAALARQHYRLIPWYEAPERLNYRRFFDINELICVRVEDARVFRDTHALIGRLARTGAITGLRIDHIDGLWDPRAYLDRLRRATGGAWVVVEKILAADESLPADWATAGTTGYDFLAALTDVWIDPRGHRTLAALAREMTGEVRQADATAAKEQVLRTTFPADVRELVRGIRPLARALADPPPADDELFDAVVALTAHLDVYRTYIADGSVRAADRARIRAAGRAARRDADRELRRAIALVERIVSLRVPAPLQARARRLSRRWQQRTGPAMAKGVEDTVLYRDVTLVARNEVGLHPSSPVGGVAAFHALLRARVRTPATMNATSTHDTKRSEDVRARLAVLSEMPGEWARAVGRWRRWNAPLRTEVDGRSAPSARDELLLYQTLVGAWPLDRAGARGFAARIDDYLRKAAREAKLETSWASPDEAYERALRRFVRGALASSNDRFRRDLARMVEHVARPGAINALGQVVLKIAAPGVPDVYQGTEVWSLRLVDPDNRAPVDLARLDRALATLDARAGHPSLPAELLASWRDGRIKLYVTAACLRARADEPALFTRGTVLPLRAPGDPVVAFARRHRGSWALAVVPRLTADRPWPPLGARAWGKATIALPAGAPDVWVDRFTGAEVRARRRRLSLAEVFDAFPVALLSAGRSTRDSR